MAHGGSALSIEPYPFGGGGSPPLFIDYPSPHLRSQQIVQVEVGIHSGRLSSWACFGIECASCFHRRSAVQDHGGHCERVGSASRRIAPSSASAGNDRPPPPPPDARHLISMVCMGQTAKRTVSTVFPSPYCLASFATRAHPGHHEMLLLIADSSRLAQRQELCPSFQSCPGIKRPRHVQYRLAIFHLLRESLTADTTTP
ncbi:hypothetical protein LX36DRAFT_340685 [Colletotrichum falcatum]|nr:hypothetical protein LX36DRAFT_340685 [Colletotrichum falcatum]